MRWIVPLWLFSLLPVLHSEMSAGTKEPMNRKILTSPASSAAASAEISRAATGGVETGNPGTGNVETGNPGTGNVETCNPGTGNVETCNPGTGNVETGNPGTGNVETGNPGTGNVETGNPGTGNVETGSPGTGNVETGNLGTGNVETGNPGTGNVETCNPGTGNVETCNPGTGNVETGNPGTGNVETGNPGTGNVETGNPGTGNVETGSPGTGNVETGNLGTGNVETGNPGTGNVETCNPGTGNVETCNPGTGNVETGNPGTGNVETCNPGTGNVETCNPGTGNVETDEFLGPPECLKNKWTRESCDLNFCSPWERCIDGRCTCKPPYLCPHGSPVCGRDGRTYRSYCQVRALSCRKGNPVMSHFSPSCDAKGPKFKSSVEPDSGLVKISVPDGTGDAPELLVCEKLWDMAAANVACREEGKPRGAVAAGAVPYASLNPADNLPGRCVSVRCHGYEMSLAECVIHNKEYIGNGRVATTTCYRAPAEPKQDKCGFVCANGKRVPPNGTCDGVDDCGDRSDEMCCKKCRNRAFRCSSGVCLHEDSVSDGIMDCLDGADEKNHKSDNKAEPSIRGRSSRTDDPEYLSPRTELRLSRVHLESQVSCGIPNSTTVNAETTKERGRSSRVRRVVGGVEANPMQIQWQVALEENKRIDCGGAYIGGCWVLTAAHCVRPSPLAFRVKFSLWKKTAAQGTTDIVPVEQILIHPNYVPLTYENDIALVKLKTLPFTDVCVEENPAISAVCVPWTQNQFQSNHTCSISGWGRTADGRASRVLRWANVSLIGECERFYGGRFKPGMMCAGDLDGDVDSCQGDSGGPLVCQDQLGVSYLWGIVSWGERCGVANYPGVYTLVSHYFEWIRLHTGWSAVTRFNS